ncbi:hypothetical protein RB195_013478 [Necator americanus]|uniref:Uncharacterized protein n=1 Tax=Necator americanus TaxID=51031 RepID=A0ABR1DYE4_NECAM
MMLCVLNTLLSFPEYIGPSLQFPVAAPTFAVGGLRAKIESWVETYEDFIGIEIVKHAQEGVVMWKQELSEAQFARRDKQMEIKSLHSRLKGINPRI